MNYGNISKKEIEREYLGLFLEAYERAAVDEDGQYCFAVAP